MPPSTSVRENALANVASTLAAITSGASYNYTVDKVARIDGPFFQYLDENYGTLAFVEEGQTSWTSTTHSGLWMATVEVFIQMAARYEPDSVVPWEMTTDSKSTIRSKLVADAVRALMADRKRGGYAKLGFLLTDDAPINLDMIEIEGRWIGDSWVAHELRFEMSCEIAQGTP